MVTILKEDASLGSSKGDSGEELPKTPSKSREQVSEGLAGSLEHDAR